MRRSFEVRVQVSAADRKETLNEVTISPELGNLSRQDQKERMSQVRHACRHLRHGTLWPRLKQELRSYRKEILALRWKLRTGKAQYVEKWIRPDVRMRLFLDSRLCREIYCGVFELKEQEFLQLFLRPGDVFIDVGA